MISRKIAQLVQARFRMYPAVVLVGPRQCGKTTFATSLGGLYFDLEQETERLKLDASWDQVEAGDSLVELAEAQSYPKEKGRFNEHALPIKDFYFSTYKNRQKILNT